MTTQDQLDAIIARLSEALFRLSDDLTEVREIMRIMIAFAPKLAADTPSLADALSQFAAQFVNGDESLAEFERWARENAATLKQMMKND